MSKRILQTRRSLSGAAALTVSLLLGALAPGAASAADPVEKLQEFALDEVSVTDAYYQNISSKEIAYIMSLDPNRLLAGFKAVSQGKDPGNATGLNLYGGWEGGWSLLRGHTIGHYLSAMARAYKQLSGSDAGQSAAIAQKIDYTIGQLKSFQDASPKGYLFASPETHFDVIEGKASGSSWAPWYTMHKIIAGLIDVYEFEGNATALEIASRLGDWAYNRSSTWNADLRKKVLGVEYGGMNDCLYDLYRLTNKANHLAAAHVFDEDTLFTPISQGNNVLPGKHANTQIPKFIGALNRYRTLGQTENFYYTAAEKFWTIVLRDHTYVTGGNSQLEHFHEPRQLDAQRDNVNNETCNSYNMLKLARGLFKATGDVKYADYYEQTHINEIMSAVNPTNGMTTYFKPMGTGYFKLFGKPEDTFWCCNGTGMENYTKLNDSLYFHDDTDLYVNMFLSSTLNWSARGLSLKQTSNFPVSDKAVFEIAAAPDDAVTINFRKPSWVARCQPVTITVNGQACDATEANGYLAVSRAWKPGDKVELTLPMEVKVSRLPDNPNAVAFVYGPVVLSAGLGTERMLSEPQWASAKATIPPGVVIKDTIGINNGITINEWIADIENNLVQTPGTVEFTLRNTDSNNTLKFTPHYQRYEDRYGIYFRLTGTAGENIPDDGECSPPPGTGKLCDSVSPSETVGATGSGATGSGATSSGATGSGATGGGATSNGSTGGASEGGSGGSGGADDGTTDQGSSGCSCSLIRASSERWPFAALFGLGLVAWRRGRRREAPQGSRTFGAR
ncbi:beta-L-arabinofuranosidase domain-containing protein [Sorangium sp. So ce185]|uniref:beta-L-arabinofuranosidase domain-containing protein n=1 Tax=Sorangium sp. So ce185 TaxID=3133287 RepID=UPI003F606CF2